MQRENPIWIWLAAALVAAALGFSLLPARWMLPEPTAVKPASRPVEERWKISAYDTLIRRVSREEGNDWRLLSAIAYHESRFTPDIVSPRGARGLMQIMPSVARHFEIPCDSLLDPETNVRIANRLLNEIAVRLRIPASTAENDRMRIVLASYNSGIGHVADARRLARHFGENPNSWEVVARYLNLKAEPDFYTHDVVQCGRFKGYRQTNRYVNEVMKRYARYCRMTEGEEVPHALPDLPD